MRYTYKELQDIVDADVRHTETKPMINAADAGWLRQPENYAVWCRELYRLRETVEDQLEMAQSAVNSMREGTAKAAEQAIVEKKSVGRLYYLKHVEKRIAEVEALAGHEPLVMIGQVRLILDAALDALDKGERAKATSFLERLQDAVEEHEEAVAYWLPSTLRIQAGKTSRSPEAPTRPALAHGAIKKPSRKRGFSGTETSGTRAALASSCDRPDNASTTP